MRSILKASLLALAVASVPAVAVVAPAHAQTASSQAAGQFVDQLADRAFAILRDKSLGRDEERRQFRAMLKQHVAVKQAGDRRIRSHRSPVKPPQYAAYRAAFPVYVVRTYADRLYVYANAAPQDARGQPVGTGYAVFVPGHH